MGRNGFIREAYKTLAASAGISGNEKSDIEKKPFVDTIAEARR